MTHTQMPLPLLEEVTVTLSQDYRSRLSDLLNENLDFQGQSSSFASHNLHSFPAKFPYQLPRRFITALTSPGAIVLDPMVGSGTTILEAALLGRVGIGYDIDPLALLISKVKTAPLDKTKLLDTYNQIIKNAANNIQCAPARLEAQLQSRWDEKSKAFIDYWFAPEIQTELLALLNEIEQIPDPAIRSFFQLVFSAIIITKSGGVSNAFDLGHTRPHRAKVVVSRSGQVILGDEYKQDLSPRIKLLTKRLDSAFIDFRKRFEKNLASILSDTAIRFPPQIQRGNAESLPLKNDSVDLLFTSPPYASNAIDYMRAHKFSLVWFGYSIDELSQKRKEYIGSEDIKDTVLEPLPGIAESTVQTLQKLEAKESKILHRYYSELTRVIREAYRVLKPGTAAIIVIGNSVLSGVDTRTPESLAEIGQAIGFYLGGIGARNLDRDKRMLPAGNSKNRQSQIQNRMHEEYLVALVKP